MNQILLITWLVVGVLFVAVAAFMQGYENTPKYNRGEDMTSAIAVGFLWPIIGLMAAVIIIISAPIWLLRKLGEYARKKKLQGNKDILEV